ncbi:MAG: hypothetical protein GX622_03590 [Bacteroidales bacterium]|jgi:hypothetical protein|nr:hypothetical protein [Bacteroidales bacterium]
MDFKDKLVQHYGFTERDWDETVSRFRPETLPARSLFLEKGKVATHLAFLGRPVIDFDNWIRS